MVAATDAFQAELDFFVEEMHAKARVPGMGIAVSIEGRHYGSHVGVVSDQAAVPLNGNSQFHLGCYTKLLVSIMVLELARAKELDLSAPIEMYLSELSGTAPGSSISLAHLISHTSGFPGLDVMAPGTLGMNWEQLVDHLKHAPERFVPGSVFSYEHAGAVIAGEIVRRRTGRSVMSGVAEDLLERLEIPYGVVGSDEQRKVRAGNHFLDPSSGTFRQAPMSGKGAFSPLWESAFSNFSVSLESMLTVADYIMGQTHQLDARSPPQFSGSSMRLLQHPLVTIPSLIKGNTAEAVPRAFGLGAARWANGFSGVSGSGFGQCTGFRFDSVRGIAVAVGINAFHAQLRDFLLDRIGHLLGFIEKAQKQPKPEFHFSEIVGSYCGGGVKQIDVSIEDDRLILAVSRDAGKNVTSVVLRDDPNEGLALDSDTPWAAIGFFREQDNGKVGIMCGHQAFKRLN